MHLVLSTPVPGPSLWELPRQAMITEAEALRKLTDTLVDVLQHESNVTATKAWSSLAWPDSTLTERKSLVNCHVLALT